MKKHIPYIVLIVSALLSMPISTKGQVRYTPDDLVRWRDSMELVYTKDPTQVDLSQLDSMLLDSMAPVASLTEQERVGRLLLQYMVGQCHMALSSNYFYSAAPGARAKHAEMRNQHYVALLSELGTLAGASMQPWYKLLKNEMWTEEVSLLELLYPGIVPYSIPVLESGNGATHAEIYGAIADTLETYGRHEGYVRAKCCQILCSDSVELVTAELEALLQDNLDTRSSGVVLACLVKNMEGTTKQKVDVAEKYKPMLRPDADTYIVDNMLEGWMRPEMKPLDIRNADGSKEEGVVRYQVKNISEATLYLYKAEIIDKKGYERFDNMRQGALVEEHTIRPTYEGRDGRVEPDTVAVRISPKPGAYIIVLKAGNDSVCSYERVSTIDILEEEDETERVRYQVVSVKDGSKVKGARLQHRWHDGSPEIRAYLSEDDHTDWDDDARYYVFVDPYAIQERMEMRRAQRKDKHYVEFGIALTDRAIYRPGQTVNMAVVLGKKRSSDDKTKVQPYRRLKVNLYKEGEKLYEKRLTTDRFGRASTQYAIPADAKPGLYRLSLVRGRYTMANTPFQVDEYRRPQAQMTMESEVRNDSCLFIATVTNAGGEKVDGLQALCIVDYRDTLSQMPDSMGRFYTIEEGGTVRVCGGLQSVLEAKGMGWRCSCRIDVTLPNGESLSETESLYLDSWPYKLMEPSKGFYLQGRDSTIMIDARDGNAMPIADVPLVIQFSSDDTTLMVEGTAGEPIALPHFPHTGTYHVEAKSEKKEVSQWIEVVVPDKPKGRVKWLRVLCPQYALTEDGLDLYLLTPVPDVTAHLHVVGAGGYDKEMTISCVGNLGQMHLDYNPHMGRKVTMYATVISNGAIDDEYLTRSVPSEKQPLAISLNHFSNKTRPGANEEWTISVADPEGEPVANAAVIATMYDASLDQLANMQSWRLPTSTSSTWHLYGWHDLLFGTMSWPSLQGKLPEKTASAEVRWQGFAPDNKFLYVNDDYFMNMGPVSKGSFAGSAVSVSDDMVLNEAVVCGYGRVSNALVGEVAGVQVGQPGSNATVVLRGVGSVNGSSSPLYVIDGVPYDGDVSSIDPARISSVSVLKDATATALYGSRGANGVIVIRTMDGGGIESLLTDATVDVAPWLRKDFREVALWSAKGMTDKNGEMPMEVVIPDQLSTWHLRLLAYDKKMRQATIDREMRVEQPLTLQPLWPRMLRMGDDAQMMAEARNRGTDTLLLVSKLEVRTADSTRVLFKKQEPIVLSAGEQKRLIMPVRPDTVWGDSVRMTWTITGDGLGDGEQVWVPVLPSKTDLLPDTTVRRTPKEVLREQLKEMKISESHDALRVALSLYTAKQEGKKNVQAESRLKHVCNKDNGICWCPGMPSSSWVTMQVMDLLLLEGEHDDIVRKAMEYLDKEQLKKAKEAKASVMDMTNDDIHYLVLSEQVEREKSGAVDSMLLVMQTAVRKHILSLKETRASVHTPLTIYGVSELGCVMADTSDVLKNTAADHVLRLSLVKPEWGRYFKTTDRNSRLLTQLSAIDLMDKAERKAEAMEMRRWLMGQVWLRAWQNPTLIYRGLEALNMTDDTLAQMIDDFEAVGLVTMACEMSSADRLKVGQTTSMSIRLSSETEVDLVRITVPMAACMESAKAVSGYRSLGGRWAYVAQYDDHVEIYLQRLNVGLTELTVDFRILRPGTYTMPASMLQSDFWPEITCSSGCENLFVE